MIYSDRIYTLEFEDYDGKPFKVDVDGSEILASLRRSYTLDKWINESITEDYSENG